MNVSPLQVSLLIRRELYERAKDFNIILDDVAITELSFSHEYTAAVEAKQVGTCPRVDRVCGSEVESAAA